jgi:protein TonB
MLWARPATAAVYPTLQSVRPAWRSFGFSLLLHTALVGLALAWTPKVIEVVRTYEVELLTAPPTYTLTPAPPPPAPQPAKPPEPQKKISPPPKPEPIFVAVAEQPKPAPAPVAPIPNIASAVQSPLRLAVASAPVMPAVVAHPATTNIAPAVASGHGPEEVSDPAYINSVRASVARHLRYPELALRRGTEGRVVLRLTLDARGKLLHSTASEPADDSALLGAALAAVRRAAPFPPWNGVHNPEATLNLTLPIRFKLEER